METLTINRKTTTTQTTTQSVTIPLPYYATNGVDFFAVTGEKTGLTIFILGSTVIIQSLRPDDLPEKHDQVSHAAFYEAYNKAMVMVSERLNPSPVEAVTA